MWPLHTGVCYTLIKSESGNFSCGGINAKLSSEIVKSWAMYSIGQEYTPTPHPPPLVRKEFYSHKKVVDGIDVHIQQEVVQTSSDLLYRPLS